MERNEIKEYVVVGILILAAWLDTMNNYIHRGYEYSINLEQKTGQHWIRDLNGSPLGDY